MDGNTKARTVVVIDDDRMILTLASMVLTRLGVETIITFQSSVEALAQLESDLFDVDLILLDLMMPELDGIEFLRELNKLAFPGYLILMSGSDKHILSALTRLGSKRVKVLGALEKPFSRANLEPLLRKMNNQPERPSDADLNCTVVVQDDITRGVAQAEFEPYFQPKVDIADDSVVGFESLARWHCSDGEVITPARFIPLAEATGQIFDIDMMILDKTCHHMHAWQEAGVRLKGSVNCSATSLNHPEACETIMEIAARNGVSISDLMIELTESAYIDEHSTAMENILRLHLYGARLSMDDFGTGYSSMQYLHKLPLSELKIDRGFVSGALADSSKRAIIESSVELASKLRLTTICEGVETYEDLAVIKSLGAQLGQGYYFSTPLPAQEFAVWLNENRH